MTIQIDKEADAAYIRLAEALLGVSKNIPGGTFSKVEVLTA